MRSYLNSVDTVQQIVEEHGNNLAILRAARKLQEVLLKHALDSVKPPKKVKLTHGLTAEEASFAKKRDGKIQAIKLYRDRTGCGLKEAKDAVEKYMQRMLGFTYWPVQPDSDGERVDSDN